MKDRETDFRDAVVGLERGDFSRLAPLFGEAGDASLECQILKWFAEGRFADEPLALSEAFTCACFNGRTPVVRALLEAGVDPMAGESTGMNGLHWAVNRGQLETVRLLLSRNLPLEPRSMHGTTALGTAVWSAVHEPRERHLEIIEALIGAGACVAEAGYPSGLEPIDELLRHEGAG